MNQTEIKNWAYESAQEYIKNYCSSDLDPNEYAKSNGFFVTMTFDPKKIRERQWSKGISDPANTQIESENFKKFYLAACRKLLGRYPNKGIKRFKQPFCFLFFDVENGKYRKSFTATDIKKFHIHALMIFREDMTDDFENWATSYLTQVRLFNSFEADGIEVQRFDPNIADMKKLIGYSSKFAAKSTTTGYDVRDLMIYPHHLHDHKPERIVLETKNYELEKLRKLSMKDNAARIARNASKHP